MYGGKTFSKIFHVPGEWREAVVWNCSYVNALKQTVLHRTVFRHRVNIFILTYFYTNNPLAKLK